jgi:hypothetical protein
MQHSSQRYAEFIYDAPFVLSNATKPVYYAESHHAECCHAEWLNDECGYDECQYAQCRDADYSGAVKNSFGH